MCKIKCFIYFTKTDYTEAFLAFYRTENYQSGVPISARTQPFCINYEINIG